MEGRYVNIVIPGRREYLTLCEVEVSGEPSDITGELYHMRYSVDEFEQIIRQKVQSNKKLVTASSLLSLVKTTHNNSASSSNYLLFLNFELCPDTNIARRGQVSQSSLYGKAVPQRAIDGNRASNWGQGSCTHTRNDRNPWWRLDLLKSYKINTVTITNRRDCCHKRINGAEIRIGNSLSDNGNANPR